MTRFVPLALIVLTVVTSLALGTARGRLQAGQPVQICAGQLVVTEIVDRDGRPLRRSHLCPDMAIAALDAVGGAPALPPLRVEVTGAPRAVARVLAARSGERARQGRGPPAGAADAS